MLIKLSVGSKDTGGAKTDTHRHKIRKVDLKRNLFIMVYPPFPPYFEKSCIMSTWMIGTAA